MKITIAAATRFEIKEDLLQSPKHDIQFLYTGVGILQSAVSLTQIAFQQKPDLIIQAGIAGCFHSIIPLGGVVVVEKDIVADMGVWENNEWKDVFDMSFQQADNKPFMNRSLPNEKIDELNVLHLPVVTGVTVNEITTSLQKNDVLKIKYNADIESMEGASLHYVCRLFDIPFLQVRGISNYVGERDKKQWKIKEAIENINEAVSDMLMFL